MLILLGLAVLLVFLLSTAELYTNPSSDSAKIYQLFLVTLAGNWNPVKELGPTWNAFSGALALLVNWGPLIALITLFWNVAYLRQEQRMKTLTLIDILNDLVEARVEKDVATEFDFSGERRRRLQEIVANAVKETREHWVSGTIDSLLPAGKATKFREDLLRDY
ncbi:MULTISPECIES: hypothetical protein [unclassified Bradyrhizobium]|uniref:hypothetical protein n=1 Tax=unclassified Bradyrhizobium TaxID=2631580 RepID=UPI002916C223|nr:MULTISPECIES: hypothetical protein [unclassified Bradyrhizobium]